MQSSISTGSDDRIELSTLRCVFGHTLAAFVQCRVEDRDVATGSLQFANGISKQQASAGARVGIVDHAESFTHAETSVDRAFSRCWVSRSS